MEFSKRIIFPLCRQNINAISEMLSKNKLFEGKNNTIIGITAAAVREARLEYLNKAAVLS